MLNTFLTIIPVSRQTCFPPSAGLKSETESGSGRSWSNTAVTLLSRIPPLIRDSLASSLFTEVR